MNENQTNLQESGTQYTRESHVRSRFDVLLIALLVVVLLPVVLLCDFAKPEVDAFSAQYELWIEQEQHGEKVPVMPSVDIEEIWAIEDARREAEHRLIDRMYNGDHVLGYDAASRTYYCSIGMGNEEAWPEVALSSCSEENASLVFLDDYTYDYCWDAIENGYRYELLAYTDTEYEYVGLVFTGLPTVSLQVYADIDELEEEDTTAYVSISSREYDAVNCGAKVHLRGGGFVKEYDKYSYNVKFHELTAAGDKEVEHSVLGMEACNEWLLVANASDKTCARNEIAWSIWRDWNPDGTAFMLLDTRMVEVFVNDEYVGIYQLMESIKPRRELLRMGGNPNTDCVARVIKEINVGERPVVDLMEEVGFWAELRYAPEGMSAKRAFGVFDPYMKMNIQVDEPHELDDEALSEICMRSTDAREMMEYFLFVQAAGLGFDNVFNNVYMWAVKKGDHYQYMLAPWDMDMAFYKLFTSPEDTINLYLRQSWRMLDLDLMDSRSLLWEIWNEKRATVVSDDAMYQRIHNFEDLLNQSGAYKRESLRWRGEEEELSLSEISGFAVPHLSTIDRFLADVWPLGEKRASVPAE